MPKKKTTVLLEPETDAPAPVVIGAKGVERMIEIKMNAAEKKEFNSSVKAVKGLVDVVKRMQKEAKKKK